MLYLIGLGLNANGISKEGINIVKKCKKVYLENYTVEFPYSIEQLKEVIGKKIVVANRKFVESLKIIDEAKKKDIALLVYGSPLTATTHISILEEAKKSKVKCKIIYSASIMDSVAETGLQIYKFGKTTSMPKWDKKRNFIPKSFINVIKDNKKIEAHSLILIDIGIEFKKAIEQLIEASKNKVKFDKIVVCSRLGTNKSKIFYEKLEDLKSRKVYAPYCIIIPGKLHFIEKEILEAFK